MMLAQGSVTRRETGHRIRAQGAVASGSTRVQGSTNFIRPYSVVRSMVFFPRVE
jgi:hypothetical protein